MIKYYLAGAALCALLSGGAFAQSTSSDSTTTQTTVPAPEPYTSKTEKSRTVDPDGVQIDKSRTYQSGNGTMSGSSSRTVTGPGPYEESQTYQEKRVVTPAPPPPPVTTTTRSTTTTIEPN